jgi:hypothetical protein
MSSPSGPDPRSPAARRRDRIDALRMRVAAVAVAGFLAVWGGLFVQLAGGHVPGLGGGGSAVVQFADPAVADDGPDGSVGESATGFADDVGAAAGAAGDGTDASATDNRAVVTRQS